MIEAEKKAHYIYPLFIITHIYIFSILIVLYKEARRLHGVLRTTDNVIEAEKEAHYIYPKKKETKVQQDKDGNLWIMK